MRPQQRAQRKRLVVFFSRSTLLLLFLLVSAPAHGQGGPPLLTDDPGTPGNRNWEINVGATTELRRGIHEFELPMADFNYGWGDHIQLKFQIPWLVRASDARTRTEFGDGQFGVKWRFVDEERGGVNISTYPQFSWNSPGPKQLVDRGNQFLLPIEISKTMHKLELDGEIGYNLKEHAMDEILLGLAAGYQVHPRLEVVAELNSIAARNFEQNESVLQLGGRGKLSNHCVLLFAAGRGIPGASQGEPHFIGYFGLQLLFGHAKPAQTTVPPALAI